MYFVNISKITDADAVTKIINTVLIKTNLYSVKDALKRNEIEIKIKMIYVLSNKYIYHDNCIEILRIKDNEEININILIHKLDKYIIGKLYYYYKECQAGKEDAEENIIKIKVTDKQEKKINKTYNNILYKLGYKDNLKDICLFKLYYNFFNYVYLNDYDTSKDLDELQNLISKCESLDIKTSVEVITNFLNNAIFNYLYNVMQDNQSIEMLYN